MDAAKDMENKSTTQQSAAEQKAVVQVEVKMNWFPFWVFGFMFTLGIGAIPPIETTNLIQAIIELVLAWFIWPLYLGLHFAG